MEVTYRKANVAKLSRWIQVHLHRKGCGASWPQNDQTLRSKTVLCCLFSLPYLKFHIVFVNVQMFMILLAILLKKSRFTLKRKDPNKGFFFFFCKN